MNHNTICDICSTEIKIDIKGMWIDNLEYKYFLCPSCGKIYVISVTDDGLRKNIRRYEVIRATIQAGEASMEMSQLASDILAENAKRSRVLSKANPLTIGRLQRACPS